VILLDTNALIWLAENDSRLGKAAQKAVAKAADTSDILVSAVSFWEVGLLLSKGRITLSEPLARWAQSVMTRPEIRIVSFDADIAVETGLLPEPLHGDPGDRFVVATARVLHAPLLTSDRKILAYAEAGHVEAIDARR
jgi:PIN domain nuclease of toxin-antitoxin system